MSDWAAKRFWTEATVSPQENGFGILLDERSVKTPLKSDLVVPSRELAEEIAAEWDAQEKLIDPLSMPATRYANAAIDKVAVQKTEVADMLAAYGETDLLCYRADAPQGLVDRQNAAWDPLLDWAHDVFGARLHTGQGITYVPQNADHLDALAQQVHAMSVFELAAFHDLVSLSGSLVVGLAAVKEQQSPKALWDVSRIDEEWQIEQWGADEEAAEFAATKQTSFENAARFYHWVKK